MSTPVRGGPQGPLGYAPRRTREQGASPADNPQAADNPPRGNDGGGAAATRAPSLREALRDSLPSNEISSLRKALSDHTDGLAESLGSLSVPRVDPPFDDEPAAREAVRGDAVPQRDEPAQMRDALSALERLTSRSAQLLRESQDAPRPLPAPDPVAIEPPVRQTERIRDSLSETLRGAPLAGDGLLPPVKGMIMPPLKADPPPTRTAVGPRDLLDDGFDIEPPRPRRDERRKAPPAARAPAARAPAAKAPAAKAPAAKAQTNAAAVTAPAAVAAPVKAKPGKAAKARPPATRPAPSWSSDVFAGDAALVALRSHLASDDGADDFDLPVPATRPARLSPMTRFMGVVALAAVGALGFLWITSPHHRAQAPVMTDEVALVDLKGAAAPPRAPAASGPDNLTLQEQAPAQAPVQNPVAVASYSGDTADKAAPAPAIPQSRSGGPRVVTISPAPAPDIVQPAAAATDAAVPPPAAVPAAPVSLGPPPGTGDLLARATDLLQHGDVAAARLLLRRAAGSDNAQAALELAGTYDIRVLKKLGITTFNDADPVQAREWYRKAAALGSPDASARLEQMDRTP